MSAQRIQDLLRKGWTVEPTSAYDEDGVDAWLWTSPDGKEDMVIGGHEELPPLPNGVDNEVIVVAHVPDVGHQPLRVGQAGNGKSYVR
jgi:hypothetical protein